MSNFKNRTMWTGDNLDIMRGMNSESVDLIYLDPPFNSNRTYAAPIGSEAAGAVFKDSWSLSDLDVAWMGIIADKHPALYSIIDAAGLAHGKGMKSYLIMMAIRLLEMKRLLKDTGSIYLHCDQTASHYLKLLMDAVFGQRSVRNEIVWHYSGWNKRMKRHLEKRHDTILFYGMSSHTTFHYPVRPWNNKKEYVARRKQKVHLDSGGREYVLSDAGSGERVRRYLDDAMTYGVPLDDVWDIPKINNSDAERVGYPTQKPLALLERIIKASSNEGDVVLDPFAGCATACVAAEKLHRQWVGIDISEKAVDLVQVRIRQFDLFSDFTPVKRTDVPKRTDVGKLPNYRTHRHVLFGKQEGMCKGCRSTFHFRNFVVDHIVPKIKGGTNHPENLQLLCGACNSVKGSNTHEYLISKLKADGIL